MKNLRFKIVHNIFEFFGEILSPKFLKGIRFILFSHHKRTFLFADSGSQNTTLTAESLKLKSRLLLGGLPLGKFQQKLKFGHFWNFEFSNPIFFVIFGFPCKKCFSLESVYFCLTKKSFRLTVFIEKWEHH